MTALEQLLQDFHVPFQTTGHKHCRPGWANMPCPFCTGNPGLHLGVHLSTNTWTCWRCGPKPRWVALAKVLGVNTQEAKKLFKQYQKQYGYGYPSPQNTNKLIKIRPTKLPSDCGQLMHHHKQYLIRRGFDPEEIEREWGVKGAGPAAMLDKVEYKNRIIIPIYWGNRLVSFQGRAIREGVEPKYKACPKTRETIPHQTVLYGKQEAWSSRVGICVEGAMDVWRLGKEAFAVFGISYTKKQIRWIAKLFKRVFIVFDDDPQAQQQAQKLAGELAFREVGVENVEIEGDPGGMKQEEARYLVKNLLRKW